MAMRINHNIPALNALRNLRKTDEAMAISLERLSSGLKINRAADGPATLVISEQMRGQIASIKQAIRNSEASTSMIQTAEAAMNEVSNLLNSVRQLTIHAANEGANDMKMLQADQAEISNALETIDRIARTSRFGTRVLLDGSNGANGVAVGEGIQFVEASPKTEASPAEGYPVDITQAATRTLREGMRAITLNDFVEGFRMILSEGGKNIEFTTDNPSDMGAINNMLDNLERPELLLDREKIVKDIRKIIAQKIQEKANLSGLDLSIFINKTTQNLTVEHKQFGSKYEITISSSLPGILGKVGNAIEQAERGRDVEGTIDGKVATGSGNVLTGPDNTNIEGLVLEVQPTKRIQFRIPRNDPRNTQLENFDPGMPNARPIAKEQKGDINIYTFDIPADTSVDTEGYVHVTQNSLAFQVGPTRGQQVKISMLDAKTTRLATGISNLSGFRNLSEIDVTTPQGAQDALLLIDRGVSQISELRATLGAFQKNTLQSNTNSLRMAEENLTAAESSLRDADMAEEMSTFTRNQVMLAAGTAMLAQANQSPQAVLNLLRGQAGQ